MEGKTTVASLKLNGQNWAVWKFQMEVVLGRELHEIVTEKIMKPKMLQKA